MSWRSITQFAADLTLLAQSTFLAGYSEVRASGCNLAAIFELNSFGPLATNAFPFNQLQEMGEATNWNSCAVAEEPSTKWQFVIPETCPKNLYLQGMLSYVTCSEQVTRPVLRITRNPAQAPRDVQTPLGTEGLAVIERNVAQVE